MTKGERLYELDKGKAVKKVVKQAVKTAEHEKIRTERELAKAEKDRLQENPVSNGINPNMAVQ